MAYKNPTTGDYYGLYDILVNLSRNDRSKIKYPGPDRDLYSSKYGKTTVAVPDANGDYQGIKMALQPSRLPYILLGGGQV